MRIDWREVRDQAAHALVGGAVIGLAVLPGSAVAGAVSGAIAGGIVGLLAEIKEEVGPVRLSMLTRVNWRDVAFYALGGLLAGGVA